MSVNSISFPKNGQGYLYETLQKPCKPYRSDIEFRSFRKDRSHHTSYFGKKTNAIELTDEGEKLFQSYLSQYTDELEMYKKMKGRPFKNAYQLLAGKTFYFDDDKINIIFGPNASGKSTILRAIGGNALTSDGFTQIPSYIDLVGFKIDDDITLSKANVEAYVEQYKENSATIDWTGNPVYYHNFDEKLRESNGYAGNLVGSCLSSIGEEMMYIMDRDQVSAGQLNTAMLKKVLDAVANAKSLHDIIDKHPITGPLGSVLDDDDPHSIKVRQALREHYETLPDYDKCQHVTLLLDEIDTSFDVDRVCDLYMDSLPKIKEQMNLQIIMVSHNPIVLSDAIHNSGKYNIVSIDDEFTQKTTKLMKSMFFP